MNDSITMTGRQMLEAPTTTSHIAAEPVAKTSSKGTLTLRDSLPLTATNAYPRIAPGVTATARPKAIKARKAMITF
ncbi:hypothetical protein FCH28_06835 [Streptomyces piniterrae]|uniref:Uncharacterized protein n=1 Tax=Streptomyces piniterrae TaxID=2571125 RepID=A0A4U0NRD7_9ACTN|nr:hypothetical protein [Streptomyces piniterrae]TJZ57161.1 hypothetical protein FCH28_06835 [Streptomyces piniterrae]